MQKIAKNLEKKSLSDKDILNLVSGKANLLTYSELMKYDNIDDALGRHGALILLFETKQNFGHWCAVIRVNKNTVEHFDSYGYKPDEELKWTADHLRRKHGKVYPHLTWLLYNSKYPKITYNEHKFQKYKKGVNTCGRWTALRIIFKKLPLNKFKQLFSGNSVDPDLMVTLLTAFL